MNPITTSLTLGAAASTGIFNAAISGAGSLTLSGSLVSGGVATMTVARRIAAVSSNAGDTTQTLALTGTDRFGNAQSETLALNGTTSVQSVYDYKTITKIVASAATAGTVSIGTNSVASTQWFSVSREMTPFNMSFALSLPAGGGTNASAQYTYDDPNAILSVNGGTVEPNSNIPPIAWDMPILSGATSSDQCQIDFPIFAFRLTVNSGTGTATLYATQAGIRG